ncbi:hypothetical protein CARUB_v10003236mg [Capsella rubella]|uniref:RNase H type-1 domain-containing protein n=1 Tax=Capsella rubella TaxID=81985 RepID=R0FKV8_9BRAS|nr:hypothetical protein CARUB_v10003236mg [Capsella rubella]
MTPRILTKSLPLLISDFLCFVDVAWSTGSGNSGFGWTFHDPSNLPLWQETASSAFVPSVLAAEALAVKHALSSALIHELTNIQVLSDSQILVRLLNSKESTVELRGILHNISLLRLQIISISFSYFSRSCKSRS